MYVIARTGKGRPTLMHKVDIILTTTRCGLDIKGWSRAYLLVPLPQILCKKCGASS